MSNKVSIKSLTVVAVLIAICVLGVLMWLPNPALAHDHEGGSAVGMRRDRLMTDEVGAIGSSLSRIAPSVAKGDFKAIKTALKTIEGNWVALEAELEVRGEQALVESFTESLRALTEASNKADKPGVSQSTEKISGVFAEIKKSLGRVEVDISKFAIAITIFVLAWVTLTFITLEVMKRRSFRL